MTPGENTKVTRMRVHTHTHPPPKEKKKKNTQSKQNNNRKLQPRRTFSYVTVPHSLPNIRCPFPPSGKATANDAWGPLGAPFPPADHQAQSGHL